MNAQERRSGVPGEGNAGAAGRAGRIWRSRDRGSRGPRLRGGPRGRRLGALGWGVLGLSLALGAAGGVSAQQPDGGRVSGRDGRAGRDGDQDRDRDGPRIPAGGLVEKHAERLGLDAATLASVQQIVRESGGRDAEFGEQIAAARAQLRELFDRKAELAAVLAQAEKLGSLESEARKSRLRALMDVRAKLTPEQLAELVLIREEVRASRATLGSCAGDLHEFCGSSRAGPEVLACMQERWSELSVECQAALTPGGGGEEGGLAPSDDEDNSAEGSSSEGEVH